MTYWHAFRQQNLQLVKRKVDSDNFFHFNSLSHP
ncbi:MAG TPA: hypothetical protein EYN58_04870 [Candidatus Poseidoniales archaeon]|nr:hypothetical protein [Candidatus Poseidoniales archaeon]HIA24975.1 hypothetical protein [Candidatus Poseidoniales archaeon]HIB41275.1 hypothetical protein [Candidatus Poseidoniales archaeon]HIO25384.1 hypothetical protein [Candidatus Poseidoniales archaeon]HIO57119.1 hypothetical protein [Candidatus Poseidoniales archaeon]